MKHKPGSALCVLLVPVKESLSMWLFLGTLTGPSRFCVVVLKNYPWVVSGLLFPGFQGCS